jgi:putative peptide zinc metalloprotease protein
MSMDAHDPQGFYCIYPPRVVEEVDVTEQTEGGVTRFVIRNSATARYFILKRPEYEVFRNFDGVQTVPEIARGGAGGGGPRVAQDALLRFLTTLESLDLLARGGPALTAASKPGRGVYIRIPLFNPERLLTWLDHGIGWTLSKPFIVASFALILLSVFGLLSRAEEVVSYASYTYAEYGLAAILLTTLTITVLHEFAHGLACKHFGGDVREMGVLMIYYVLPAFYCNVTDIHRMGRRRERLWVIFAGIYFQLFLSAAGALAWLVATPHTLISDTAFLVLLGGTFNILFNCNPLIKLDGYYALSQFLRVQNLQAESSQYVRSLIGRLLGNPRSNDSRSSDPRSTLDRSLLYLAYWVCSILYSIALIWIILAWVGPGLMNQLGLLGVALTLVLAVLLTEKWWKPAIAAASRPVVSLLKSSRAPRTSLLTGVSSMSAQTAMKAAEPESAPQAGNRRWSIRRSTIIKATMLSIVIAVLLVPWEASTGSDCALLLPPGREGVARANTDAVLTEVYVQPGDTISQGARIARFSNPDIEDRLTQLNAEITRLDTGSSRIEEELRVRSEVLLSASFTEVERKRLATELKEEAGQIAGWDRSVGRVETSTVAAPPDSSGAFLPASLAVLKSEIDLKQTELEHNRREAARYKKLVDQGLIGEQQYDRAVAAAKMSEKELQGARARLEAAMVDHRRLTSGAQTSSLVAETEARAARSNFEALIAELHANRQQIESLRQRRDLLQREYEGMSLLSPRSGVVLGDDLRKMVGRRYGKGEEICRIGELERFLLRIDVNEREIANVRLDSPVRFKLKTVPGRTFTGVVSKINAEAAPNQYGQKFYAVEVSVDNSDNLLRPGMTGFARISFGRQSIGLIVADKLWQSLRPELWLF